MVGTLRPEDVVPRLRGRFGQRYLFVDECESTQRLLTGDEPEGAVVATDHQTEGRGRLGRRWIAPPGTSVLCSVALTPQVPPERLAELSLVAGRACAAAIAEIAPVRPNVKFPNDVLIGGRKVAGMLAEAREGRVVLGIGINVRQREAELPETSPPATSLFLETGRHFDRAELLAAVLAELEREYDAWVASTSA